MAANNENLSKQLKSLGVEVSPGEITRAYQQYIEADIKEPKAAALIIKDLDIKAQDAKGARDLIRTIIRQSTKKQEISSKDAYNEAFKLQSEASMAGARVQQLRAGMDLFSMMKPLVIGGVILFLVIGPGLGALLSIFQAMDIWLWVVILAVIIVIWRRT